MVASSPPPPPPPSAGIRVDARGKFRKARVKPMERYGTYRGEGTLTVDGDGGVAIEGRRVKPPGQRIAIALAIMVGVGILTGGAILLGVIPLYLIVEYGILDRANCRLNWSEIVEYAHDPKRQLISFRVEGWPKGRDTVVFRSSAHTGVAASFAAAVSHAGSQGT
jgi:hypothetical protein